MLPADIDEFRAYVRALVEREVAPGAAAADAEGKFPQSGFEAVANAGVLGLGVDESLGGVGLTSLHKAVALEEIARRCSATAITCAVQMSLVLVPLCKFTDEEQRRRFVPPLARGEVLGSFCLTEAESGSDSKSMTTVARCEGSKWVIDGSKRFITSGSRASVFVVLAKAPKGITAFVVEKGAPGLSVGRHEEKMGWRGSDTVELSFDGLEVPDDGLIGEEGQGFKYALATLDAGRIGVAAMATGTVCRCLELAVEHAKNRVQFGKPIAKMQAIRFMLADMALDLEVSRRLTYHAAELETAGAPFSMEASMAKLFASEAATRACVNSLQIHGGDGYMKGSEIERLFRDVKVLEIGEGTSQVQRMVIARAVIEGRSH